MSAPVHVGSIPTIGVVYAVVTIVLLIAAVLALVMMARKFFQTPVAHARNDWEGPRADMKDPSVFITASMQGVIEKLRAQEKELARLHMLAQERAQESERLTEEMTRHMPTGLLLVNAMGAITSSNPAAENALGLRPMRYRSYNELLGEDSGRFHTEGERRALSNERFNRADRSAKTDSMERKSRRARGNVRGHCARIQ